MVLLKQGEKILLEDRAKDEDGVVGTLILTNQRLTFEITTGLITKKTDIKLHCSLNNIANVAVEGMFSKKLTVQVNDEYRSKVLKHFFSVPNPNGWEMSLKSAIQSDE